MALWLGSLFTMGMLTARARATGDPKIVAFTYAANDRLYRGLIVVSAVVTIVAGVALMLATGRPWFRPFPEHWLFQMQIVGLAALEATLFIVVPNSRALSSLAVEAVDRGERSLEFVRRVKRQAIAGSLVGVALVYLVLLGALRF
jgi:uncharacterized membrane protein